MKTEQELKVGDKVQIIAPHITTDETVYTVIAYRKRYTYNIENGKFKETPHDITPEGLMKATLNDKSVFPPKYLRICIEKQMD